MKPSEAIEFLDVLKGRRTQPLKVSWNTGECIYTESGFIEALDLAVSTLRQMQEREQNEPCGWCSYFKEEIESFYVDEYGDDKQFYRYCPICGRQMKGERDGTADL